VAAALVIRLTEHQGQAEPVVVEQVAQLLVTRQGLREPLIRAEEVVALIQTVPQQQQRLAATAAPVS
jgi:hypothetical protein